MRTLKQGLLIGLSTGLTWDAFYRIRQARRICYPRHNPKQ